MKTITVYGLILERSPYGIGGNYTYYAKKEDRDKKFEAAHAMSNAMKFDTEAINIDGEFYFKPDKINLK